TSRHSSLPADSLQFGRRLLFLALARLVNEIECHRRSLEPPSPIINRPNGVGLRKLIYECLNEWVRHFAGALCVDEGENWSLFSFDASRYQTAPIIWGIYPSEYLRHVHGFCPRRTSSPCKKCLPNPRRRGLAGPKTKTGWAVVPGLFVSRVPLAPSFLRRKQAAETNLLF